MRWYLLIPLIFLISCEDPFAAEEVRFYRAVATGGEHPCAVATDGSAWCWGRGYEGQLGTGVKENRFTPTRVRGDVDFTDVTVGVAHSCGLATDGSVYCWGWNAFFERGNTTDPRDAEPVRVETTVRFRSISAGDNHTCGVGTDSLAYCWGANTYGQLGDGTTRTRAQVRVVSGGVKFGQVTAGAQHTCALQLNGNGYCWGKNDVGQLGIGTTSALQSLPIRLNTAVQFRQIDAGAHHTCAVAQDFRFYCWGGNEYGELGFGGSNPAGQSGSVSPHTISDFVPSGVLVSAGVHHTCAIGLFDLVRCWGRGTYGQLATGAAADSYHPAPVFMQPRGLHQGDLLIFQTLAAGGLTHACGMAEDRIYCWGTGDLGALGFGSPTYAPLPQRVPD